MYRRRHDRLGPKRILRREQECAVSQDGRSESRELESGEGEFVVTAWDGTDALCCA